MTNPNPSVPDPNAYPASSPQQSSYQYQGGVPPQGAMQPGNGAAAQGNAQAGHAGYGYAPMAPVKRRVSYKLAGILSGIGALLAVSPFVAWFVIELIPGNHGDGGDGLRRLGGYRLSPRHGLEALPVVVGAGPGLVDVDLSRPLRLDALLRIGIGGRAALETILE